MEIPSILGKKIINIKKGSKRYQKELTKCLKRIIKNEKNRKEKCSRKCRNFKGIVRERICRIRIKNLETNSKRIIEDPSRIAKKKASRITNKIQESKMYSNRESYSMHKDLENHLEIQRFHLKCFIYLFIYFNIHFIYIIIFCFNPFALSFSVHKLRLDFLDLLKNVS